LNNRSLRLELAPSFLLAAALIVLHAAAALCLALALPGAGGLAGAAALVALGAAAAWRSALLRAASSVRALELAAQKLEVRLASGESFAAEVAERRYVGRYMVVLPLRRPVRRTLLVTRDMADAESFRRLRIWALWGKVPGVATKQLPA
jgi:Membrane-bound toxin component of toxin-antitoxin system